jgi:DNA repair protein RadA/Sms
MARTRTTHRCSACGAAAPKWSGRCAGCGDWNTLEEHVAAGSEAPALVPTSIPVPVTEVGSGDGRPVPTGIDEVDRVLGGGLVPGSVTLIGGEPGVGKSTVVLQLLAARARRGDTVLYVTGEESVEQVRLRAGRIGALDDRLLLVAETALPAVLAHLDTVKPALCVIDSVQTLTDPVSPSAAGSVVQVRECAQQLVAAAKSRAVTMVLVGHVTKDGQLSGPRLLEHVVDTVVSLDGDRHHDLRLLRAVKHRFGPTDELGMLAHSPDGMAGVPDPSALFLADRRPGVPGGVVVGALEGHRPLLVEVQALVAASALAQPRRSVQGLDGGRVALLLAVLAKRVGLQVAPLDVYAMTVGGVRVAEPAADLAVCMAVASSLVGRSVPADTVVCGEVGLGGELRQVGRLERRLGEAARLGFRTAVLPRSAPDLDVGLQTVRLATVTDALDWAGLLGD